MGTPAWIVASGVVGTWFIFAAAIWGEKIRSSLFKPRLRVTLDDPRGELTRETITTVVAGSPLQQYTRAARYYHLTVRNARRWPVAHDVRILITRLETPDPGGVPTTVWTGEIPLQWEHAQINPASRSLGRPARADLAVVAEDTTRGRNELHLLPVIEPANFQRSYYSATHIWVTMIATATETDSAELRLEIAWDGQWNAGESEMARHLVIR